MSLNKHGRDESVSNSFFARKEAAIKYHISELIKTPLTKNRHKKSSRFPRIKNKKKSRRGSPSRSFKLQRAVKPARAQSAAQSSQNGKRLSTVDDEVSRGSQISKRGLFNRQRFAGMSNSSDLSLMLHKPKSSKKPLLGPLKKNLHSSFNNELLQHLLRQENEKNRLRDSMDPDQAKNDRRSNRVKVRKLRSSQVDLAKELNINNSKEKKVKLKIKNLTGSLVEIEPVDIDVHLSAEDLKNNVITISPKRTTPKNRQIPQYSNKRVGTESDVVEDNEPLNEPKLAIIKHSDTKRREYSEQSEHHSEKPSNITQDNTGVKGDGIKARFNDSMDFRRTGLLDKRLDKEVKKRYRRLRGDPNKDEYLHKLLGRYYESFLMKELKRSYYRLKESSYFVLDFYQQYSQSLRKILDQSNSRIDQLKTELETTKEDTIVALKAAEELKVDNEGLRELINDKNDLALKLSTKIDLIKKQGKAHEARLQTDIDSQLMLINQKNAEITKLQKSEFSLKARLLQTENHNKTLSSNNNELVQKFQRVKQISDEAVLMKQEKGQEVERVKRELIELAKEKENLAKKVIEWELNGHNIQALKTEIDTLKDINNRHQATIDALERENQTQKHKINMLSSEKTQLQKSKIEASNEKVTLRKQLERMKSKERRLLSEISTRKKGGRNLQYDRVHGAYLGPQRAASVARLNASLEEIRNQRYPGQKRSRSFSPGKKGGNLRDSEDTTLPKSRVDRPHNGVYTDLELKEFDRELYQLQEEKKFLERDICRLPEKPKNYAVRFFPFS